MDVGDGIFPAATLRSGPHTFRFAAKEMEHRPSGYRPFSLAADNKGYDIESLAVSAMRSVAMQHGPAWEPSTEYDAFDLVGQTIDYNGRGVGEVVEYDKSKVTRGHVVKWEVGPATKLKLEKKSLFLVMNTDYVNVFVDKNLDQAIDDFKRADQKNLEKTEIMVMVSAIRIERKMKREAKGIDLKDTMKLAAEDYLQMFAELDRKGMGECIVTAEAVFGLFILLHEPLDQKYEKAILKEMEKANEFPSSWEGDLSLQGFTTWVKSDQKIATKLMYAAVHLKELELQRAIFDQLDDDSRYNVKSFVHLSLLLSLSLSLSLSAARNL